MELIASQLSPSPLWSRHHIWWRRKTGLLMEVRSQLLNEIMPLIYKRFTDKTAEEWRQIYKVRLLFDHRCLSKSCSRLRA